MDKIFIVMENLSNRTIALKTNSCSTFLRLLLSSAFQGFAFL